MRCKAIEDFRFQKSDCKNVKADELKARTKEFALRTIKLVAALPKSVEGRAIANQLVRSGTSVAANYRSACRARSRIEFVAKLGIVLEEADESLLWLELIVAAKLLPPARVERLLNEADELVAIMAASRKSALAGRKSEI
jgi:four helix bundle protein